MKTKIKNSINKLALVFLMLMSLFILGCGCNTSKPTPDPLAGFHASDLGNLDSNKAITDDYKNYIQTLSPEERKYIGVYGFYENGTGQHAVKIEVDLGGKDCWYHILFYDKENKRIKIIKYYNGRYQS